VTERIQVSMILRAEIKTLIIEVAKRHGCSFSQAGEALIKRALAIDAMLKQLNQLNRNGNDWMKP
jgi:hypothetical protein